MKCPFCHAHSEDPEKSYSCSGCGCDFKLSELDDEGPPAKCNDCKKFLVLEGLNCEDCDTVSSEHNWEDCEGE